MATLLTTALSTASDAPCRVKQCSHPFVKRRVPHTYLQACSECGPVSTRVVKLHHPTNLIMQPVPTVPAADLGTQRHCIQHFLLNLLARTARQMDTGNMVKTYFSSVNKHPNKYVCSMGNAVLPVKHRTVV